MSKKNNQPMQAGPVAQPKQPGMDVQLPRVAVITYVTISFINNTSAIKIPVDGVETGKKILDEVEAVQRTGATYYNKERGILFKTSELSHAFLSMEKVTQ